MLMFFFFLGAKLEVYLCLFLLVRIIYLLRLWDYYGTDSSRESILL